MNCVRTSSTSSAVAPLPRSPREWLGEGHVAAEALKNGVAVHHGALPRAFLAELEELLHERTLSYVIASPTVAQGLDLSASVLVFRSIYRPGRVIDEEEYRNVVGRVGRAFVDLDGVSVLPIDMRRSSARAKRAAYERMVAGAQPRMLESGIFLLIARIIEQTSAATQVNPEMAVEYLLGQAGDWLLPPAEAAAEREFDELVASLDAAILSIIENPEMDVGALASAIDAAMRGSLWSRTLARHPPIDAQRQHKLLVGRAEWIWRNSSRSQRRGFFAAAVGYQAGAMIHRLLDDLLLTLLGAERAFARDDVEEAGRQLAQFARVVGETRPFAPSARPDDWPSLLQAWVSGDSVADARQERHTSSPPPRCGR